MNIGVCTLPINGRTDLGMRYPCFAEIQLLYKRGYSKYISTFPLSPSKLVSFVLFPFKYLMHIISVSLHVNQPLCPPPWVDCHFGTQLEIVTWPNVIALLGSHCLDLFSVLRL